MPGIEAVEELKKHGHIIEKYFIAGSLKGSYFWGNNSTTYSKSEYDICIISEWETYMSKKNMLLNNNQVKSSNHERIFKFRETLTDSIISYLHIIKEIVQTYNYSIAIALRYDSNNEINFLSKMFGNNLCYIENDGNFSTYHTYS